MANKKAPPAAAHKKRTKKPPSAFGIRLRAERLRAGLSQEKLGKVSGVHAVTINCLESGYTQAPTWKNYKRLVAALPGVGSAGAVDESKLLGWTPAVGTLGTGVRHTPQLRLLRAVANLSGKGVLGDVQELLDAAHADGFGVAELLSVVTTQ